MIQPTVDQLIRDIAEMERPTLIDRLTHFDAPIQLDFSAEYLEACSTDKLRHILMAACLQARRAQAAP